MKNKIVFAGSPDFAVESLQRLYDNPNNEIQLVISQQDKKRNRNKFSPTAVKKKSYGFGNRCYYSTKYKWRWSF